MRVEKPTLAFVDHSFHKKTKSLDFISRLLEKRFTVQRFWDDSWKGEMGITAKDLEGFGLVVFCQIIPSPEELQKIRSRLIWIPMYDSVVTESKQFWEGLRGIPLKIVSFSTSLSQILSRYSFDHLTIRFFPNPAEFTPIMDYSGRRIFFWQRGSITFDDLKPVLGGQNIDRFLLLLRPDPHYKRLSPGAEDIGRFNIQITNKWFRDRIEYLNLLGESNIFIAPREYEGIGMSFLEAMGMGMVVIAANKPVASEYIQNGVNGFLFEKGKKGKFDLSDLAKIGRQARKFCEEGYGNWLVDRERILEYVSTDYRPPERKPSLLGVIWGRFGH